MSERKRMMPRDGAGQMELTGGTGPVMHPIGLEALGFLEIYKIDRTFCAQSPDAIDPKRTKPNVPWSWRVSDEVGCGNAIVARVFIQCAEALNNKPLKRGDPEKIKTALHTCKEDLRNCEKAFGRVLAEHDRIVNQIGETQGLKVEKRVVNDLPQIPNLEHDATIFLTSAKRAIQSIGEVLNQFYGITISNARVDKGRAQLQKLDSPPADQMKVLDEIAPLIERVLNLRNFQDHTPKKTIVDNFTITATELLPPMWRVHPESPSEMLPEMHDIIGKLIEFAEHAFFVGLLDRVACAGPFTYFVEEIPEAEREGALRYRCELRFTKPPEHPGATVP
jgi:hypothetical protein